MLRNLMKITTLVTISLVLAACAARPAGSAITPAAAKPAAEVLPGTDVLSSPIPAKIIENTPAAADPGQVEQAGSNALDSAQVEADLPVLPVGGLSAEEAAGLAYMREEEKLAHDIYLVLFNDTGFQAFQNIANSEQSHTEAVKNLLDRYGLDDPAAGKAAGQFTDQALQSLYDQLALRGSQSLSEALKVGAAIEEIDILDLKTRLAQTTQADILLVYQYLDQGSRNHLRSFTSRLLSQSGETYQPQYLSLEMFQAIISAASEPGSGMAAGAGAGAGAGSGRGSGQGNQSARP